MGANTNDFLHTAITAITYFTIGVTCLALLGMLIDWTDIPAETNEEDAEK